MGMVLARLILELWPLDTSESSTLDCLAVQSSSTLLLPSIPPWTLPRRRSPSRTMLQSHQTIASSLMEVTTIKWGPLPLHLDCLINRRSSPSATTLSNHLLLEAETGDSPESPHSKARLSLRSWNVAPALTSESGLMKQFSQPRAARGVLAVVPRMRHAWLWVYVLSRVSSRACNGPRVERSGTSAMHRLSPR